MLSPSSCLKGALILWGMTSSLWTCANMKLTGSVPGLALEADILIRAGAAVPVVVAPRVDQDPGMSLSWKKWGVPAT